LLKIEVLELKKKRSTVTSLLVFSIIKKKNCYKNFDIKEVSPAVFQMISDTRLSWGSSFSKWGGEVDSVSIASQERLI
jgi:hypothetical protein